MKGGNNSKIYYLAIIICMKIVHLIIRNEYTDGWAYQENLIPEAHKRLGHEVVVIATTVNSLTGKPREVTPNNIYEINGVKVIRLAPRIVLFSKRLDIYNSIEKALEYEKPEIIFIHGINFLSLGEVRRYKKKYPECVVVGDTHSDYGNSLKRLPFINKYLIQRVLWRSLIKKNLSMFDIIYYVAIQTKVFAMENYSLPETIMKYLPMGGDVTNYQLNNRKNIRAKFREKIGVSENTLVFITGGRFRESKKLYELITAFQMIKFKDIKLVIFGKFEDSKYKNNVMNLIKNDNRIKFIGWLNPLETTEAFLSSDMALFSGTQSVIWRNAVACGLPVVCRYTFGSEEIDVGGNAIHIYSDDPFAWKQIISHIVETPELLNRMKKNSLEKGIVFFNNDRIAQIVIDDAKEVIKSK
ncbi:glycosyltransferase family 4 protein [Clostridium tertium]|uniref:glycosyltransferase family 4 protein n=1 Tax=Clostridium tertium TaxID=1559 RepID=UPI0023B35527|nr:glycosyltransferase family 4 protein [Clostridium tertium]